MGNFKEKLYKTLDIEREEGGSMIEIRGRSSMSVAGCERIVVYRSDLIRLALCVGEVSVTGERLVCSSYCGGGVRIEGDIMAVAFSEGEDCGG